MKKIFRPIKPGLISGIIFEDNMDGTGWATYSPDKQCRYTLGRVITINNKRNSLRLCGLC